MTENLSTGDILQLNDTHCQKKTGNNISTILGIIGAIIVLALLWNSYTRARDTRANTDAISTGAIGGLQSGIESLSRDVASVVRHERADAIKLAYTDGMLFGRMPFYGAPYGPGTHGQRWDGGCGGCGGCDCGSHQQFREVRQFAETSDNIEVINTCGRA